MSKADRIWSATASYRATLRLEIGVLVAVLVLSSVVLSRWTNPAVFQSTAQNSEAENSEDQQPSATPKASPTPSTAVDETMPAPSLGGAALPYRILLPADYAAGTRRYPVLYLLHGLGGNEDNWWDRTRLAEYAAKYRLIVVTPGADDSWYANSASNPRARYEDVIIRDLIPYIDAHYRTIARRDSRAIAGLSMGGLGAMKFALRYPELFAFAGSLSGAFDVPRIPWLGNLLGDTKSIFGEANSQTRRDNDVFLLLDRFKTRDNRLPYFYVSIGKSDPLVQVLQSNPRFAVALRAKKLRYEYAERPGSHDWQFWDSEISLVLGRMCVIMPAICM